jgi:hypothetical protein
MQICSIDDCANQFYARGWCENHYAKWRRKGTPHRVEMTVEQRFLSHVRKGDGNGCWVWSYGISRWGYGIFCVDYRRWMAHRWSYEHFVGPVPDGRELDHVCHSSDQTCSGGVTCRHRRCCNPAHLEPVTHAENIRRAIPIRRQRPLQTECKYGHPFDEANTYVTTGPFGRVVRQCRQCAREWSRAAKKRAQLART